MKSVGVAILGLGVVGSGTYKILRDHREFYKQTQGVDITVESVLEIRKEKALALGIEESKISDNIAEVISNPNVDVVVESTGIFRRNADQYASSSLCELQGVGQQILYGGFHFHPVCHEDIVYIVSYELGCDSLFGESGGIPVIYFPDHFRK